MSILCFIALKLVAQHDDVGNAIEDNRRIIRELCSHSNRRKSTDYFQRYVRHIWPSHFRNEVVPHNCFIFNTIVPDTKFVLLLQRGDGRFPSSYFTKIGILRTENFWIRYEMSAHPRRDMPFSCLFLFLICSVVDCDLDQPIQTAATNSK